jgi:hypothetical protein
MVVKTVKKEYSWDMVTIWTLEGKKINGISGLGTEIF